VKNEKSEGDLAWRGNSHGAVTFLTLKITVTFIIPK
jgi:hypothetical protein